MAKTYKNSKNFTAEIRQKQMPPLAIHLRRTLRLQYKKAHPEGRQVCGYVLYWYGGFGGKELRGFFVNIKRPGGADCVNIAEIAVSAADIEEIIGSGLCGLVRDGFYVCKPAVLDFMKAVSFCNGVDGVISQTYIPIAVFAASLADICLYLSNNVLFVTHCFIQYIILPVF